MTLFDRARWLPWTLLAVSLAGFADAMYLTVKHFSQTVIPCSLTHGCEIVTTSVYATPLGIPVALLGAIYYFAILTATFVAINEKNERILLLTCRATIVGLLASVWLVVVQVFILHAICQWCMISAVTSTSLFILGYVVAPRILKPR